ncbi:hypothetical protein [Luteolibacter marinus]|uniref:hypothetical protein n=1 Tax=Luteolibacter marinus TaxID=2776705 RepID=UPI001865CE63|nr:hypothetical protein [Luteolibacter marinus]
MIPIKYLGRAKVEAIEHRSHAKTITPLRAAFTVRELDLEKRRGISFQEACGIVAKAVKLRSGDDGVTIDVLHDDPKEAQIIATSIAVGLDSPQREKEMAAKGIAMAPYSDAELQDIYSLQTLENMLQEEAVRAGYVDFLAAIDQASRGDERATALVSGEDFSRRWTMFRDLAPKIGYYNPPGEPLRAPNRHIWVADIALTPASPKTQLWMRGAQLLGLALAGLLIFVQDRRNSPYLRPAPPAPRPKLPEGEYDDPW